MFIYDAVTSCTMSIHVYDFHNLFGPTHKSAGIEEYVDYALEHDANTISVISSGNLVSALKKELTTRETDLALVNLVNQEYKKGAKNVPMEQHRILRDAQEREAYLQEIAEHLDFPLGKVVDVTDFLPQQYSIQAKAILKDDPEYVAIPVGSGKLFLSIYRTAKAEGKKTRLIGLLPKGEHGLSTANQVEKDGKLYFKKFHPKNPADKLVSPYILESYRQELLQAAQEGHQLIELDAKAVSRAKSKAKKYVPTSEYSSAVGFITATKAFRKTYRIPDDARITVVHTGKGTGEAVVDIPIWNKINYKLKRGMAIAVTAAAILAGSLYPTQDQPQEDLWALRGDAYCHMVYAQWLAGNENEHVNKIYQMTSEKKLNNIIKEARTNSVELIAEKLGEKIDIAAMSAQDQETYIAAYKKDIASSTRISYGL